MIIRSEDERLKRETIADRRSSSHLAIALWLICSLSAVAIVSKNQLTNHIGLDVVAFAILLAIGLYFRNQILLLGTFAYVTLLILILSAAVLFGI